MSLLIYDGCALLQECQQACPGAGLSFKHVAEVRACWEQTQRTAVQPKQHHVGSHAPQSGQQHQFMKNAATFLWGTQPHSCQAGQTGSTRLLSGVIRGPMFLSITETITGKWTRYKIMSKTLLHVQARTPPQTVAGLGHLCASCYTAVVCDSSDGPTLCRVVGWPN